MNKKAKNFYRKSRNSINKCEKTFTRSTDNLVIESANFWAELKKVDFTSKEQWIDEMLAEIAKKNPKN